MYTNPHSLNLFLHLHVNYRVGCYSKYILHLHRLTLSIESRSWCRAPEALMGWAWMGHLVSVCGGLWGSVPEDLM